MELQNRFVLSDFVLQTYLNISTYNSNPYDLKNQMQEVIHTLQRWVDNWGGSRRKSGRPTEVGKSRQEANQIEEIVIFKYWNIMA